MKRFKLYEEFLNESEENFIPKDLALITIKYLIKTNEVISREIYFSQEDRNNISKEWGNRLPRNFAGPEKPMLIGNILAPVIYDNPSWRHTPYLDDNWLIIPFHNTELKLKVDFERKIISSKWEEIGEWLKKHVATKENLLDLWLDSDLSLKDFKEKYKIRILGGKYGL